MKNVLNNLCKVDSNGYGIPNAVLLNSSDTTLDAWLVSKPNIKYNSEEEAESEVNKLVQMNLPISGFQQYCLTLYSSIYFRDLLFCVPHIVPWSQSTRNLEMSSSIYQISNEVASQELREKHSALLEQCRVRSMNGEALDVVKLDLPCTTMMAYSFWVDRRTLITFCKTLEFMDKESFDVYGTLLLRTCGIELEDYKATRVGHIYDKLCITDSQVNKFIGVPKGSDVQVMDGYALHTVKINYAIAAQFIRQHFSNRRYYEFNRVKQLGYQNCLDQTLRDRTIVSTLGDETSLKRTLSRRSCWFAVFDVADPDVDSWSDILDDYVDPLTEEQFKDMLPCKGCAGKCDIVEEFKLRALKLGDANLQEGLTAADRNEICPILREMLSPEKTVDQLFESRQSAQGSNSKTFLKWKSVKW